MLNLGQTVMRIMVLALSPPSLLKEGGKNSNSRESRQHTGQVITINIPMRDGRHPVPPEGVHLSRGITSPMQYPCQEHITSF